MNRLTAAFASFLVLVAATAFACSGQDGPSEPAAPGVEQATQGAAVSPAALESGASVAEVVAAAGDAVVRIETGSGVGSGFIVDSEGYIITNFHVVEARNGAAASPVEVTLADGGEYPAEMVGFDATSDLALLKIEAETALVALTLASLDDVQIGQQVVAIGYALDLAHGEGPSFTVTSGIVSQKNRAISEDSPIMGAVQTDAAINHGNSGGPLLNMQGEVIGVNTALQPDYTTGEAAQGIGYAVGADMVAAVYEELRADGSVDRGLLGIQGFESLRPAQARELGLGEETQGVYLATAGSIPAGGPAAAAGLRAGDVILSIDGDAISDEGDLAVAMIRAEPGAAVDVVVMRNGEAITIAVTLGNGAAI